jgi:hypothetical protein
MSARSSFVSFVMFHARINIGKISHVILEWVIDVSRRQLGVNDGLDDH